MKITPLKKKECFIIANIYKKKSLLAKENVSAKLSKESITLPLIERQTPNPFFKKFDISSLNKRGRR